MSVGNRALLDSPDQIKECGNNDDKGKTTTNTHTIINIYLLCNKHYFRGFACSNTFYPTVDCIFIPVFQVRELKLRRILGGLPKVT